MFGGQSTVNLSSPLKESNAMWKFNLNTLVWSRVWANNTPGVPFLKRITGDCTMDGKLLFVSGSDHSFDPPRTSYYSLNISMLDLNLIPSWKELPVNDTVNGGGNNSFVGLQGLIDAVLVTTHLKLFIIGGKYSDGTNHICTFWDLSISGWFACQKGSNLVNFSVGYNSHLNRLVALGGSKSNDNFDLEMSWVSMRDGSKMDSPWLGLQFDPLILPSRRES
ncbi:hypothetical protein HK096_009883, partial [Nowakowskiella sp. JEL0078]